MLHENFKEMIHLALLDELNDEEMKELHQHLIDCSECQTEYDELSKYLSFIDKKETPEIDLQFLQDARRQLRSALDYEISRKSFFEKSVTTIGKFFFINRQPALAGAFSLIIGLTLGYLFFAPVSSNNGLFGNQNLLSDRSAKIANVRFSDPLTANGEIEFTFDAVKAVKMKGNINDPAIQKLLAEALINEKNPGVRIRTVNALSTHTGIKALADPEIKSALISAAEYDANPGVRREALKSLLSLPYDSLIKNCLLYVLGHDNNSAMRIVAINGLASESLSGQPLDEETMKILNQRIKQDDNEYIKIRAASLLKEDKLQ